MKMSSLVLVVLVLVVTGASELMAGQASTDRTALEKLNDESITAAVQGKLATGSLLGFARVAVDTERGTVILSGVVPTSELKARAEQLARQINGVKQVTNNLQVN